MKNILITRLLLAIMTTVLASTTLWAGYLEVSKHAIHDSFESVPEKVRPKLVQALNRYNPSRTSHSTSHYAHRDETPVLILRHYPDGGYPTIAVIHGDRGKQAVLLNTDGSAKRVALPNDKLEELKAWAPAPSSPVQKYLRCLDQLARTGFLPTSSALETYEAVYAHAKETPALDALNESRDEVPREEAGNVRAFKQLTFNMSSGQTSSEPSIRTAVDTALRDFGISVRMHQQLSRAIATHGRWSFVEVVILQPQPTISIRRVSHPLAVVLTIDGSEQQLGILNDSQDDADWFNTYQVSGFQRVKSEFVQRSPVGNRDGALPKALPESAEMLSFYQDLLRTAEHQRLQRETSRRDREMWRF